MGGQQSLVLNGNKAAAWAAKLARVEVVAAYPISPQTPLVEYLAEFIAQGELKAEMVEVESEHSALSVLQGAALAGSRTFTGTSSQGLALMYEPYLRTSTLRLPIVMAIATREVSSPQTIWCSHQDALTVRDAGWIQFYAEDCQEIFDAVLMAYKIAEDTRVLLPVNVCYDGFFLSHRLEKVEVPSQEEVDVFLPPYRLEHVYLDPERPMAVDPLTPGEFLTEYRIKHVEALKRAREVICQVDGEYAQAFGRSYSGLVETYRWEDAQLGLVTLGAVTGTARVAVDQAREKGERVGLIKIRVLRPFPAFELSSLLSSKKAIGIIDRNVCFGWGTGILFMETMACLAGQPEAPRCLNFIGGLGGCDITLEHLAWAIEQLVRTAQEERVEKVNWFDIMRG